MPRFPALNNPTSPSCETQEIAPKVAWHFPFLRYRVRLSDSEMSNWGGYILRHHCGGREGKRYLLGTSCWGLPSIDLCFLATMMTYSWRLKWQENCSWNRQFKASRPRCCILESSEEIVSSGWTVGRNTLSIVKRETALKGERVADVLPVLFFFFSFLEGFCDWANYKAVSLLRVPIKWVEMIIKFFADICHCIFLTTWQHGSLVSLVDCLTVL